jgi:secondary thiamine-phosphate synthase enzyme
VNLYTSFIEVRTDRNRQLVDITDRVSSHLSDAGVRDGICALYSQGATAALMIQENADPNITLDVLDCLDGLIPAGKWRHDRIDDNAASHIQSGIVGASETVPIRDGRLALSTWQNIFLCDFDGPRRARRVMVTIIGK